MSPTQFIDLYCERTDPSFWSEPLNALTNASFLIGAWYVWRVVSNAKSNPPWALRMLPALLAAVGICSFLFHTLAVLWAAVADQLTILLFGGVFLYAFLYHAARLPRIPALTVAVLFGVASYYFPRLLPPGLLNQSGGYLPYLIGLLAMMAWLMIQRRAAARQFAGAIALFCLALLFRTVDQYWCTQFPLGTHFLWHLLNGAVLALLSVALLHEVSRSR